MKKTLVIGASTNPERYAYKAVKRLKTAEHEVIALGKNKGDIEGIKIETIAINFSAIHTVSLYINPQIQRGYYDYILGLKPKRIIFNPGAENAEFETLANQSGISTERACTLVLLSTGQY